nr:GSU2403 family nucleotidyltransferase fold protein [Rhizobium sp. RCAM05973]
MQVKKIDLMYQTMLAELGQRSLDAAWSMDFPHGRFTPVTVKQRRYWYFDIPDGSGGRTRRYVGSADDPEIAARVEAFKAEKDDFRARRRMVSTLTREGGMVAPDRMSGDIIEALAAGGLFRLRAVLIGTVAYQTYAGILAVRLPGSTLMTGDTDVAQDHAISHEVEDSLPPILDLLHQVDQSFRPIPHRSGAAASSSFANRQGYKIEFLTSNRGPDEYLDHPTKMPALGGASADPLRFLDFLIRDPVRTVMLHKSGIPVTVPDPSRYAVHKLIVASRRYTDGINALKRDKDIRQAGTLFAALAETRRSSELALAYIEAWERGPGWQQAIKAGAAMLDALGKRSLIEALSTGFREVGEEKPLPV